MFRPRLFTWILLLGVVAYFAVAIFREYRESAVPWPTDAPSTLPIDDSANPIR
jgi:hypothetical protein